MSYLNTRQAAEHLNISPNTLMQKPAEKVNHALVLGGRQGIGKDTLLEPVKYAIGPSNFAEISPAQLLGRFIEIGALADK